MHTHFYYLTIYPIRILIIFNLIDDVHDVSDNVFGIECNYTVFDKKERKINDLVELILIRACRAIIRMQLRAT